MRDGTHAARGHHDLVVHDDRVLVHLAKDVASGDVVADLEVDGVKVPLDRAVQRGGVDAAGDVDGRRELSDRLERALDAVVDVAHQACGGQFPIDCDALCGESAWRVHVPGPSSTESGLPVRRTGSPIVMPEVSSYTWIVALSWSMRIISPTSLQRVSPIARAGKYVLVVPDSDQLVHRRAGHVLTAGGRAGLVSGPIGRGSEGACGPARG